MEGQVDFIQCGGFDVRVSIVVSVSSSLSLRTP